MHHLLFPNKDVRSDPRGLGGSLAAVIALTLALAAALQAGISRLAVPDFSAALAISLPSPDQNVQEAAACSHRGPASFSRMPRVLTQAAAGRETFLAIDPVRELLLSRGMLALPPPA